MRKEHSNLILGVILGIFLVLIYLSIFKMPTTGDVFLDENLPFSDCEELLDEDAISVCYYLIAKDLKNPSVCEKISNQLDIDVCYGALAIDLRDIELCEMISNETSKNRCYGDLTNQKESHYNSKYTCSYNAYNCKDFETHAEAQDVFESCGGISNILYLTRYFGWVIDLINKKIMGPSELKNIEKAEIAHKSS